MLALVTLVSIRTRTAGRLADSYFVYVSRRSSNIKGFHFVCAIRTESSVPVNQEHALRHGTIKSFQVRDRRFGSISATALLLGLFAFRLCGTTTFLLIGSNTSERGLRQLGGYLSKVSFDFLLMQ
jgi:hypothetical protein